MQLLFILYMTSILNSDITVQIYFKMLRTVNAESQDNVFHVLAFPKISSMTLSTKTPESLFSQEQMEGTLGEPLIKPD